MTATFTSWIGHLAAGAALDAAVAAATTRCSIHRGVVDAGVDEIADAGRSAARSGLTVLPNQMVCPRSTPA